MLVVNLPADTRYSQEIEGVDRLGLAILAAGLALVGGLAIATYRRVTR